MPQRCHVGLRAGCGSLGARDLKMEHREAPLGRESGWIGCQLGQGGSAGHCHGFVRRMMAWYTSIPVDVAIQTTHPAKARGAETMGEVWWWRTFFRG